MSDQEIPDLSKLCKTRDDWREATEQLQRRNKRLQEINHRLSLDLAQTRLNLGRS